LKFKNTHLFSIAANTYKEYGYYTDAIPDTKEYYEFWDEERRKCLEGHTIDKVTITGYHYFYLNYCPIDRAVDVYLSDGTKIAQRERTFPAFYDGDYDYFHVVDRCRRENKHLSVLKGRRKGYSYKSGSMMTRNYFHVRNSKNFVFAEQKEYLIGDGILSKAWDFISFIDDNTAWTQPRLTDKEMHKQSGYKKRVNGADVALGMKSQIIGVSLKDNPDKVRGKAGELIFFEEAGSFNGLLKAWEVAMPTMRQGNKTLGTMIAFGTGGKEGVGFESLEELFYHPDAYDCLGFENEWDAGATGTRCGYFVPIYQSLDGFIDDNGNSDTGEAIAFEDGQREKKRNANDPKALDQYVAEHPFSPQEATLQVTANLFDVNSLKEQYNKVKANNLENEGTSGVLYYTKEKTVGFRPSPDVYPVYKYPHRKGDKTKGAVVVYEDPYKNKDGDVPHSLYIICHDPYAQSGQGVGESLGASYVIKRPNNLSKPDDIIVASYVGRPQTQDEYNANLFMLADFYNAKIGFENDRGELIAYAKRYRKLHKLQEEFEMLDKRELRSKVTRRQFGMHMTQQRKKQGELYIRDWLISPRGTNEEGVTTLNMHKIYDPALLQELIKFNYRGNFDRVMALMIGMYHTRELYNREVVEITNDRSQDDWFNNNYK
tara:strand:- start:60 stop:2027 length:1968 start_codon:yes stop_codon:yes gene_type:complete